MTIEEDRQDDRVFHVLAYCIVENNNVSPQLPYPLLKKLAQANLRFANYLAVTLVKTSFAPLCYYSCTSNWVSIWLGLVSC